MLVISVVYITYYCYTGEAFQDFIAVMRQFPTKINKQQLLVDYTMDVILQNCEIGELDIFVGYHFVVKWFLFDWQLKT